VQTGKDGNISYSAVRQLQFGKSVFSVKTYPIPARDQLTLILSGTQAAISEVSLVNMQGQTLLSRKINLPVNDNPQATVLPLQNVAAGIYLLKITNGNGSYTGKVVVQ
jgi:hypothetical protein